MNKSMQSSATPENRDKASGNDALRITVVSPNKQHLDEIVRVLGDAAGSASVSTIEGKLNQHGMLTSVLPVQSVPDILIVDSACDGRADLAPLERLGQVYPNMAFIVLCEQQSHDFLIQAMRVGVREVLPSPVNADALKAAIERLQHRLDFSPATAGKVLAFISCKGGSGATFLAANLAYALAAQSSKKVALFDFNLQFGDALLFLSEQKPSATLADVARGIHRLDPAFLASSMIHVAPNLGVLAAPEDPAHGIAVLPEHIETLLKMARSQYDFIIIDAGRSLDAQTITALDQADMIFAVLQITLPFIRDGKRLLDVFRTLDYPKDKVHLIVNRFEKGGDIALHDLEQTLGSKVLRTIPNHYEAAAASVNQGIPINKLSRNSPIAKALNEWSEQLLREPEPESSSWLTRVFKHV
ncbi:AAA family ATPase [Paraherbaspirillum soli]|uniref:CpaE family protein n=1 Tax=Paraherbaspirillum soli TaxID=631222 RepID=A0ABW0MAN6_9BURK